MNVTCFENVLLWSRKNKKISNPNVYGRKHSAAKKRHLKRYFHRNSWDFPVSIFVQRSIMTG